MDKIIFTARLNKTGTSVAIYIPSSIRKIYKLKLKDVVQVTLEKKESSK